MKTIALLLPILVILGFISLKPGARKYVCTPCGRECDSTAYEKSGICPVCTMALVDNETVTFKDITFEQLCQRLNANRQIVLLDVRSKGEFNNTLDHGDAYGRLKNAININITELERRVSELDAYKDKEVIVYCSHSHRSPEASYFLSTHGFKNVENIVGGVSVLSHDQTPPCLKDTFIRFPQRN